MSQTFRRLSKIFFKNLIRIISLLLAVSIIAFALVCASPIDPVGQYIMSLGTAVSAEQRAALEDYWGVNDPPVERYLNWLSNMLRGDLGESAIYRRPVMDIIAERFANSLALMICSWALAGILGFALGCLMGMFQNRWPDRILKKICYLLSSVPTFWLGLLFLLTFAVRLRWFPIGFSSPIGMLASGISCTICSCLRLLSASCPSPILPCIPGRSSLMC